MSAPLNSYASGCRVGRRVALTKIAGFGPVSAGTRPVRDMTQQSLGRRLLPAVGQVVRYG